MGGTVINADSLQCYRDLQILTARPDAADAARAPHRLYGFLDAAERGSVGSVAGTGARRDRRGDRGRQAADRGRRHRPLSPRADRTGWRRFPKSPSEVRRRSGGAPPRARRRGVSRAPGGARCRRRRGGFPPATRSGWCAPMRWCARPACRSARGASGRMPAAPYRFATILLMPPRDRLYAACDARFAAMIERGALAEAAALAARAARSRSAGDEGGGAARADAPFARRDVAGRRDRRRAARDAPLCQAPDDLVSPSDRSPI